MEFLRSFLRCHLVGKPVVALPNVGCFLRLAWLLHTVLPSLSKFYTRREGEDAEIIWSTSTFPARQSKWGVVIASRWSVYFSSFVQQKASSLNMTFPEIDTKIDTNIIYLAKIPEVNTKL